MVRKTPPDWVLGLLLIAGIYLWQRTVFPLWMIDLLPIQTAAQQWQRGDVEWIYTPIENYQAWSAHCDTIATGLGGEGFGNPYYYPPFVAAALAPLSGIHAIIWRNILFAVNVVLIFVNALLILRLCRITISARPFLWATALVLVSYPMSRTTKLGQIVPLLAALTWIGLLWLREHKWWSSGTLLGVVSAVKVFPVGLIAFPLIARRLKVSAIWLATVVAIYAVSVLALGLRIHVLFWQAVKQFGTLVYTYQGNQALIGWYLRLFRDRPVTDIAPYTDATIRAVQAAILIVVMGGTVGWMRWHRRAIRDDTFPAFVGLLIAGLLLSLSTSWDHYWLFELPVLGWAIRQEWTSVESRLRLLWILAASFLFLMKLTRFYGNDPFGRMISGSQTVGMIMLWVWLLWRVRSPWKIAPSEAMRVA